VTTKRVIDHSAETGGGTWVDDLEMRATVTVREMIRALQVLPGDYKLWLDCEDCTPPVRTVDVDHETQEVTFG
jgi:hypothetical protein